MEYQLSRILIIRQFIAGRVIQLKYLCIREIMVGYSVMLIISNVWKIINYFSGKRRHSARGI